MLARKIILYIFILFGINSYSQIELIYPDNNATLADSSIIFGWNKTSEIEDFNLQISTDSTFTTTTFNILLTKHDTLLSLNNNQKYFWRVKSNFETQWSDTFNLTLFNIKSIDSLHLWYNADYLNTYNNGDPIDNWADSSENNLNLLQSDNLKMPLLRKNVDSLNNHSTVAFDGINDYLKFTDTEIQQPINYFFFTHPHKIEKDFFDGGAFIQQFGRFSLNKMYTYAGAYVAGQEILIPNNYYIFNFQFNSPNSKSYINNNLDAIGDNGANSTTGLTLGSLASGGNNCNIDIAEVIVIKDSIPDSLRTVIHNYLRYKYAPPVNLGYNIHISHGFCDTTLDAGARFTNYLWSTGDTTQTISVNQSGQYSVTVTDIFGFESSDSLMVYYPQINEQLTDTLICYGDTIKWDVGLQDTNYTFLWQNNETDSIHSIFSDGNYYVQITDTNGIGCIYNSDTAHITINNYPITTTLGNDTSLCAGQNLYLQVGAGETIDYLWNTSSTDDNITINTAGEYSVTTTNTIGCIATDTINILIHGNAPIPGFDFTNLCFTDSTIFTDTSLTTDNSNITSWNWNFGNFETSNQQNPTIQYADTGVYSVSLTILTDSNCSNLLMRDIEIHSLPISNFTNTQLCQENNILFTNLSTIDKGTINSYYWSFGNGDTSTDTNPTYLYNNYGYYNLQLISTSDFNCKDTLTQEIEIKPSPISDFLTSATCRDKIISFYNNSTSLAYNPVYETHWDFGDGTTSDAENPNYLFYGTDTLYNVSLRIKSINGCQDTILKQIRLYNNPKANFTNDKICAETYTQLTNSSTITNDTITSYVWQVGNTFYYNENPTIFFNTTGQTNISLTTTSTHGCRDNHQEYIPVLELPDPDFEIIPQWGITNEYTVFTSQNEGNNFWDFGNGNTATDSLSYTIYPDSGMFIIQHVVVDSNNCIDTIYKDYRVVIPQNDIAITDVRYTINNNILSVETDIINIGNLPVNKIKFTLSPDKYSAISEIWEGELIYGSGMTYHFNANYSISDNNTPDYICVIAEITDKYTDTDQSNNTFCTDNNNLILYPIYPNPSSDFINISFKLDANSNVEISLFDNKGKLISNIENQDYDKGFHKLTYDISSLSKASYTIKISIDNKTETTKFIKN